MRKIADTASTVGIEGAAPIRSTQMEAANIGVAESALNGLSIGEQCRDRADKANAGAGAIDGRNCAAEIGVLSPID